MRRLSWTPEETEYLERSYGTISNPAIYAHLPHYKKERIKQKACSLGLKCVRYWTEDDLDYINNNIGIVSDDKLAAHLKRSVNAIHLVCVRRLHINHKCNIYTAREVAALMGIACSKTITSWMRRGWISGSKTDIACGGGRMWNFTYEEIEKLVRIKPWLFDCRKMEESYFRSIVKEEYAKNPWYSLKQAARLVGVAPSSCAMTFYIKKKWLYPVKKPIPGGDHWQYVFFKSDIERFLANDPRELRGIKLDHARRTTLLKKGCAVRVYAVWKMKCPKCGRSVRVRCDQLRITGSQIKAAFLANTIDKECNHKYPFHIRRFRIPYRPHRSSKPATVQ